MNAPVKRTESSAVLGKGQGALNVAYDEGLAQRVHEVMLGQPALEEKRMFGGVGFLLHGNMSCGVFPYATTQVDRSAELFYQIRWADSPSLLAQELNPVDVL
jgi:hypothetical protein